MRVRTPSVLSLLVLLGACRLVPACSSDDAAPSGDEATEFTGAEVGPEGGEVTAPPGSGFAGVSLKIPAGALSQRVRVSFQGVLDDTPLPDTAERVGPAVKLLPEGTTLAVPAELTVPLNREMVAAYEQTPAGCKVWARSGAGWEKLDAVRSTDDTVTVPVRAFTTAAAGVNFAISSTCTKDPSSCTSTATVLTLQAATLVPPCEPLAGSPLCITKLPMPEKPLGIDEFSTLNVVGRKVLWAMSTEAGPTIARYDLDAPGAIVKYAPYAGAASGTIEGRGVVQLTPTDAWVGLSGIGNVRFTEAGAPTVFDSSGGAGVGSNGSTPWRFRRQNVVNNGLVSKTDVRVFFGVSNESNFAFNYPILPAENLVAYPSGNGTTAFVRSVHRGLATMADQGGIAAAFMKWDAQDGRLGTADDTDAITYGAAAFQGTVAAIARGSTVEIRSGRGYQTLVTTVAPPGGVRDLAFQGGALYIVGSRAELYVVNPANGAFQTVPLPTDEPGMVPWRLRTAGNATDLLLVTRGELIRKGSFYILRPAPR